MVHPSVVLCDVRAPGTTESADSLIPARTAASKSEAVADALAVETALAINRLDTLIAGRVHDLDVLKALAESLKAGSSKAELHQQLLLLARSSQEAFGSLQSSRDALVALHRKATGGEIAPVIDKATGLPNVNAFNGRLEDAFRNADATSDVVIMVLDIGALSFLVSEAGSRTGYRVLRRFATILRKSVKRSDFIARVGPHQFAIIFEHLLPENAAAGALRIHDSLQARLVPSGDPLLEMLSVAIVISGRKIGDLCGADLLQRARDSLPLARKQIGAGIYLA